MVSPEFFEKIAIYWVLEGSGHLEKFQAPTDKKHFDPKKSGKKVFIFCCGFKKCVFVKNRAIFFVFRPWCPLQGPCALKRLSRFQAKKRAKRPKNMLKIYFLVRFQKMFLRWKRSYFLIFFRSRPLVPPSSGAH